MDKLIFTIIILVCIIAFFQPYQEGFDSLPPYHLVWMGKKTEDKSEAVKYAGIPISINHCKANRDTILSPKNLANKTIGEQCELKRKLDMKRKEDGMCYGNKSSIRRLGRNSFNKCIAKGGNHKRCSCYNYCLCVNKSNDPTKCDNNPMFRSCVATDRDEPNHIAVSSCS